MTRRRVNPLGRRGVLGLGGGRYVAIVRTGGTPTAYLPPVELAHRFEQFRDLLRSLDSNLAFTVASSPMRPGPVVPTPADPGRRDQPASAGYSELVRLLCHRRLVRRIYVVLASETAGADGLADLELRVSTLTAQLVGLGLSAVRLEDRPLEDAATRWGWTWERSAT
jgi:hypothetical protein